MLGVETTAAANCDRGVLASYVASSISLGDCVRALHAARPVFFAAPEIRRDRGVGNFFFWRVSVTKP